MHSSAGCQLVCLLGMDPLGNKDSGTASASCLVSQGCLVLCKAKKKNVFCSGKEQLVLCQGQNEGKEHRVWQGGDELSPIRIFFFMHPFHSMAGANLSGGFHDPAKAPALGGIFLVAPVPVLAELIQGKITLQMCFVLGQISPMCWLFVWPETVPGAREEAVSQGLGRQVLPWQN